MRLAAETAHLLNPRMRLVIQRVSEAAVTVSDECVGRIGSGLLVLIGFGVDDSEQDLAWCAGKLTRLRIFADEEGVMNRNVEAVGGSLLLVSQFTLMGSTKKGNRPSWIRAAPPEVAEPQFEKFVELVRSATSCPVETGSFGADMQVSLVNDGPVTILIDSKAPD